MNTVNSQQKEQTGGWFSVQIYTTDELVSCPNVLTNENASKITIVPSSDFLDVLPVGESIKIKATPRTTKNGTSYSINGDFKIAVQSKQIDTFLNKYRNKKVVLIGIKHFGQQKMYGSKLFPLSFSYNEINGTKLQDGSLFQISVSGKIPQKPVFIND